MKYIYQITKSKTAPLGPAWQEIEAETMGNAARKVARAYAKDLKPPYEDAWIMIECADIRRHKNGSPISVHGYSLTIKEKQ